MQIKKQTDQAIRILIHLSNRRHTMVGKELAGLVGVSVKFLPYIMQQLRRAGLVSSSSGTSGGYLLSKSASKITLLDVMSATADEPQISCYNETEIGVSYFNESDALMKIYSSLSDVMICSLSSITIKDLSDDEAINATICRLNQCYGILKTDTTIKMN